MIWLLKSSRLASFAPVSFKSKSNAAMSVSKFAINCSSSVSERNKGILGTLLSGGLHEPLVIVRKLFHISVK